MPAHLEINEVTTGASLSTGTSSTTEKHNTVKSYIKSRKMRAPVQSRGLEPGWIGFTTMNLTNWAMLSSHENEPQSRVPNLFWVCIYIHETNGPLAILSSATKRCWPHKWPCRSMFRKYCIMRREKRYLSRHDLSLWIGRTSKLTEEPPQICYISICTSHQIRVLWPTR